MRKLMLLVMTIAVLLTGCAIAPSPTGAFGTVPVQPTAFVVYQCSVAKETFVKYQPQIGQLQLLPVSATITENAATWHASYPGGDVQSPQLYKDLLGKIDGNVNPLSGERYYRIHGALGKNPSYTYSTVDPVTGNGEGITFFQCTTSGEPPVASTGMLETK